MSAATGGAATGWGEALLLGLVQGLTEFLPISSSAHLAVVGQLLGGGDPGAAFTAVTQLGTETAVLVYFRHDIVRILRSFFRELGRRTSPLSPGLDPDARLGWLVIVGTLPIGVLGLLFEDAIEGAFRDLRLVATTLAVLGLVLGWADRRARNERPLDRLTWRDGLLLGLAQAAALVPGVSRSGGTITAALLLGYTREAAARYSFLLAIPAVLLSGGYQLLSIGEGDAPAWGPTALATVVAGLVGYAVIVGFLKLVSTRSFMPFVVYRLALAATILGLLAAGVLTANPSA